MVKETQQSIHKWQLETFGPSANIMRTATRANEEMAELLTSVSLQETNKIGAELADVFIVLCGLASPLGFDILEEVNKKMAINRKREWNFTNEGHGYHVEKKP